MPPPRLFMPRGLALLALALLPALPVIVHNSRAEGRLTFLTTHGGINLYMGNHEHATGYPMRVQDFRMTAREMQEDAHRFAEKSAGHTLSKGEGSAWWSSQARQFMREHPGRYLGLLLRKFHLFWSGTEVDDLRMVEQVRLMTGQLSGPWWTCFALFSAGGLFGLLRAGTAPALRILTWSCVLGVVSLFITTRYRMPMVPVLGAWAAAGLTVLAKDWSTGPRRAGHLAALALALGLAAWPGGLRDVRATDYYNVSVQWLAAGEKEKALATARSGLALEPGSPDLLHAEGGALFQLARYDEAARSFAVVVQARPAYSTARYNLALSLARAGRPCEALQVLDQNQLPDPRIKGLADNLRGLCQPRPLP